MARRPPRSRSTSPSSSSSTVSAFWGSTQNSSHSDEVAGHPPPRESFHGWELRDVMGISRSWPGCSLAPPISSISSTWASPSPACIAPEALKKSVTLFCLNLSTAPATRPSALQVADARHGIRWFPHRGRAGDELLDDAAKVLNVIFKAVLKSVPSR